MFERGLEPPHTPVKSYGHSHDKRDEDERCDEADEPFPADEHVCS
jgi:hypothetical protein